MSVHQYGEFKIEKKLLGGAMGKTFLVQLLATGVFYVMKCLDYFVDEDKAIADSEISQMLKLASKFTVVLVETIIYGAQICLIMEYYKGGDLKNTITELQKIPEKDRSIRVWEIFGQMARALHHLHSNGIMHRDLKPANIFMNEDGSVRLGDFGLVKDITDKEYATKAGTNAYMAPEGHLTKKLDFKSDIFSLGIIIFQLLTNQHPFDAPSEAEMIEKIKKGKASKLPGWVSAEMKKIVEAMLSADASKRPTTEQIMEQETIRLYLKMQEDKERMNEEKDKMKLEFDRMKSEMAKMQQAATEPKDQIKSKSTEQIKPISKVQIEPSPKAKVISIPKPKQILQSDVVVKPQLVSINPQPIIVSEKRCRSEGMKIIHSEEDFSGCVTSYNPIITKGIVRFEGFFEKGRQWKYIGITDSSVVFTHGDSPYQPKFCGQLITYACCGELRDFIQNSEIKGNSRFEDNQKVALEVNMDSTPRTLHFFVEGIEQPLSVINIPASIRFWFYVMSSNSSFTLTQFQNLSSSSAKGVEGSKKLDWGK
ncbi:MAG: putative CMGC kinase, CK2 family [Streblomastix strix]|uniref:non-specific serine/threonine protein kinase n=1 Tax=Streblomastix strix TaxID=222440 RepID=A0A5J4W457_9EUKA|nr:MAG: putative CMGC kinase, CK2 family [Streblomastix strix]